jgi:2-oxoglutarate dehydrogenase E2 component (dihydrolipoamide succinyltransferase)
MGVSVAEGTIALWHKQPGDWVEADETICEITTDKIDSEVPSPASGRVLEILVAVDATVPVGSVLARIATDAVAGQPHPDEHLDLAGAPSPRPPAPSDARPAAAVQAGSTLHRHYSPVVQRIANREGVDLAKVPGSGRGGRVRKQDVLAYVEDGGEAPLHTESPYQDPPPEEPGPTGEPARTEEPLPTDEPERLSRMRRSIAEHMVGSLRTAAHCTSIVEADMSRVEAARRELGLSYLPFVARCTLDALRAHPDLNATLEGETLTRHRAVNLGIAVSLDGDGLIVPVIRDAQDLSHEGLGKRIADLAQRARAGTLTPDEVRGGTFTITNPGGFGTIASTPIINQPQVAILDLEAVVKRAVVLTDADGGDSVAIRPVTNLCLSWDHRALDGALAARFLGTLRRRIEDWGRA